MSQTTENVTMQINDAEKNETPSSPKNEPEKRQLTPEELETLLAKDVNVSLRLIYNFKNILEVMCGRGALKASEMAGVGQLYNDIKKLITNNV